MRLSSWLAAWLASWFATCFKFWFTRCFAHWVSFLTRPGSFHNVLSGCSFKQEGLRLLVESTGFLCKERAGSGMREKHNLGCLLNAFLCQTLLCKPPCVADAVSKITTHAIESWETFSDRLTRNQPPSPFPAAQAHGRSAWLKLAVVKVLPNSASGQAPTAIS